MPLRAIQAANDRLVGDPGFDALKRFLIGATGLAYYENRDLELAEILSPRISELGIANCSAYLALLKGDRYESTAEANSVFQQLTVGETYFFRDVGQFEALRETVLPEVIAKNRPQRRLSIWSAGCSSGAEVYSVAILLGREFQFELEDWQVRILGTDINLQSLEQARTGRYTDWFFRSTPEAIKRLCFRPASREWEIAAPYRRWTYFEKHNLVRDPFPAGFDVILFRNVAIYFNRDTTRTLIKQFGNSLNEEGWLMTGACELAGENFDFLYPVTSRGSTVYRKHATQTPFRAHAGSIPRISTTELGVAPYLKEYVPESSPLGVALAPSIDPAGPAVNIQDMCRLADRGEWEEAEYQGEALAEKQPRNPLVCLYYALVLEHRGRRAEAEAFLRKGISLDPRFVLAHYHLGLLLRNDTDQAVQSFECARALLDGMPADHAFAEADGITADELKQAIEIQLRTCRAQRPLTD